jgi:hypothetical protein
VTENDDGAVDGASVKRQRQRRVPGGRPHRHNIRLSEEQQTLIAAAAEAAGMSVPNLLVETMLVALAGDGQLSVAGRRALATELLAVRRLLTEIGMNVNQLAAVASTSGQLPPEVAPTMHAVAAMANRLDAALAPVDHQRRRRRKAS